VSGVTLGYSSRSFQISARQTEPFARATEAGAKTVAAQRNRNPAANIAEDMSDAHMQRETTATAMESGPRAGRAVPGKELVGLSSRPLSARAGRLSLPRSLHPPATSGREPKPQSQLRSDTDTDTARSAARATARDAQDDSGAVKEKEKLFTGASNRSEVNKQPLAMPTAALLFDDLESNLSDNARVGVSNPWGGGKSSGNAAASNSGAVSSSGGQGKQNKSSYSRPKSASAVRSSLSSDAADRALVDKEMKRLERERKRERERLREATERELNPPDVDKKDARLGAQFTREWNSKYGFPKDALARKEAALIKQLKKMGIENYTDENKF